MVCIDVSKERGVRVTQGHREEKGEWGGGGGGGFGVEGTFIHSC